MNGLSRRKTNSIAWTMWVPFLCFFHFSTSQAQGTFNQRVVADGFNYPWEILMGPDQFLWVTERVGKRIVRVDPNLGTKQTLISFGTTVYQAAGQDGLLGMALHPNLSSTDPYVYAAYTYDADPGAGVSRRIRIVRLTYNQNPISPSLGSSVTLIQNIPASNDHNSGRLVFGPDEKLYYTVGDQGANQFDNRCNTIRSLDLPTQANIDAANYTLYVGKVLRMNLDGTIPADNPVINGVRSHIYSYGHRNAQGLAFTPNGKLFVTEHGPRSDDELNEITAGKNYGWPRVAGYQDNQNYQYVIWSSSSQCSSTPFGESTIPNGATVQQENTYSHPDLTDPVATYFTKPAGYNFGGDFIQWPTIAPSSLDVYTRGTGGILGWENSLLIPSLKKGRIYRVKFNSTYTVAEVDTTSFAYTQNRYRDIALSPNQLKIYVATDNGGSTSGPTGGTVNTVANQGAILEFDYVGVIASINDDRVGRPENYWTVKTYPVPTTGTVSVEVSTNATRPFHYQVVDLTGRVVRSGISSRNRFDVDLVNCSVGVYYLKIQTAYGEALPLQKIIKK